MCSDLQQSGIDKLRDNIIICKDNFKKAIDTFFNTLIEQGYDMKSINKIITMYQLNSYIPKAEINRKEAEIKNAQSMAKQNIKDQQKEVKQGV